jgi:uncharacterized protein YggE
MKGAILAAAVGLSCSSITVVGTADLPRPVDYVEVEFSVEATKSSAVEAIAAAQKSAKAVEKALLKYVEDKEDDIDVSEVDVEVS